MEGRVNYPCNNSVAIMKWSVIIQTPWYLAGEFLYYDGVTIDCKKLEGNAEDFLFRVISFGVSQ